MSVTLNLRPLQALQAVMRDATKKRVQVGLFSNTAARKAERGRIDHNPSLGAVHEFGLSFSRVGDHATTKTPARSFLGMPMRLRFRPELERIRDEIGRYLTTPVANGGGSAALLQRLGQAAGDVVDQAFATGGWGFWPALSPRTIRRKRSSAILIETKQLREAVSYRVV